MAIAFLSASNARNGYRLGTRIGRADTIATRVRGLLGRSGLADGEGLLIEPCSGVHTWFMRFPIDVAFLSRDGEVLRLMEDMAPFRAAPFVSGARSVLELPAGTLARAGVVQGDRIAFESARELVA